MSESEKKTLVIWSCNQCDKIIHSWPKKYCKKYKKFIPTTIGIPSFCKMKEYEYKELDLENKDDKEVYDGPTYSNLCESG